jgi:hypothetical protein
MPTNAGFGGTPCPFAPWQPAQPAALALPAAISPAASARLAKPSHVSTARSKGKYFIIVEFLHCVPQFGRLAMLWPMNLDAGRVLHSVQIVQRHYSDQSEKARSGKAARTKLSMAKLTWKLRDAKAAHNLREPNNPRT